MPEKRHVLPDDSLIQYWDDLIQGKQPAPVTLDPAVIATILRVASLDDAPAPTPAFVRRLREELMEATPQAGPGWSAGDLISTPSVNGRSTRPAPMRLPIRRLPTPPWILGQVPAAALLLLILVASMAIFSLQHLGADHRLAILPAAGTPAPVPPVAFVWQSRGDPNDPLGDPSYFAIDPHGNLWAPDGRNSRFQIFAPDGTLLEVWGEQGSAEGQFNFMEDSFGGYGQGAIAFDAAGNFYVVDTGNYRVQKFGPDRRFLTAWGSNGTANGQFEGPTDVAVDGQGRVFVVDPVRGEYGKDAPWIQVFDADGAFLAAWGDRGTDAGQMINPNGLTIAQDDTVWVADFGNHRIQHFSPDGALLTEWGSFGGGAGQFYNPTDVAVDAGGRIWVSDWQNRRVQVLEPDGTFVATWGDEGKLGERKLLSPSSLVLDGQGFVYVADIGRDEIQKYRLLPPLAPS